MDIYYWVTGADDDYINKFQSLKEHEYIICASPASLHISAMISIMNAIDKNPKILWVIYAGSMSIIKKAFVRDQMAGIAKIKNLNSTMFMKPSKIVLYGNFKYVDSSNKLTFDDRVIVDVDGDTEDSTLDILYKYRSSKRFKPATTKIQTISDETNLLHFDSMLKFKVLQN